MMALLSCPFCGEMPTLESAQEQNAYHKVYQLQCGGCGARGPHSSLSAISAWNRRADDWQPIETAPRDRPVEVYAPQPDRLQWGDALSDLPEIMCIAKWHTDAGFCVCTIREVTHWREVRRPLPKGPGG